MVRPSKRVLAPDTGDVGSWYTRGEVGKILGCCRATVQRLDGTRLHPVADERGVARYHPAEVHAIRHHDGRKPIESGVRTKGQIAAAVFKMLDDGASRRDIVVALEIEPDDVQKLFRQWLAASCDEAEEISRREETQRLRREETEKREREQQLEREQARERRALALGALIPTAKPASSSKAEKSDKGEKARP